MKISFCADLHLNISKYGRINQDGLNFRTLDFMSAFERTVDENISTIKPDYFIILGDIYDSPHPPSNVGEFFQDQIVKLVNNNINVIVLIGNHDICKFHHALQPTRSISKLKNLNSKINVCHKESIIDIHGLPLLLAFPYPVGVERQEIGIREAFYNFCKMSRDAVNLSIKNKRDVIFLGHFGISGAKMNDGCINRSDDNVQIKDLEVIGANYVFLGDYHAHQKLPTKTVESFYVGSLERSDFSDLNSEKGYILYDDSKTNKIEFVKSHGVRRLIEIEGDAEKISKSLEDHKDEIENSIVKIRFIGERDAYKKFGKFKKEIRKNLEENLNVKHVLFDQKVNDEQHDIKVEAIRKEIEKVGYLEASDIDDIIVSIIKEIVKDELEQQETIKEINDIVATVKSKRVVSTSTTSKSSVLIHGIKMHNFLRYGEENNIVEFDKGAKEFLELDHAELPKKNNIEKAKTFLEEVLSHRDPRIITIIGMTDGDPKASNGSGKSTVFEAISYGFFEKLVREYVRRPESKGASTLSIIFEEDGVRKKEAFVDILFSADGALWLLRRGRKLGKNNKDHSPILNLKCLYESGDSEGISYSGHRTRDDGKTVLDLVKMTFDTFVNSIMYGQNDSGKFITGSDKTRKEIIINALQLGIIDDYLGECRNRKKTISDNILGTKSKIEILDKNSQINVLELEKKSDSNTKNIEIFEKAIMSLKEELEKLQQSSAMSSYNSMVKEHDLRKQLIDQKEKEINDKKESLVSQKKDIAQNTIDRDNELKSIQKDIVSSESSVTSLQKLVNSFGVEENKKQIDLVGKAKEFKPKRLEEKRVIEKEKEDLFDKISSQQQNLRNVEKELTNFNSKKEAFAQNEKVLCSDCKQAVTKEYVDQKILEKNEEKTKIQKDLDILNDKKNKLLESMKIVQDRLDKIELQIDKEPELISKLKDYNSNKDKISETLKTIEKFNKLKEPIEVSIKQNTDKLVQIDKGIIEIDSQYAEEIAKLKKDCEDILLKKTTFESEVNKIKEKIVKVEKDIKDNISQKDVLLTENGRIKATIEDNKQKILEITKLKDQLVIFEKNQLRNSLIEEIFGINGVQTKLVEKYIPLFNSYVKEFVNIISGGKVDIDIATDGKREGKVDIIISGDMSSDCFLSSGGEGIKIKLALSLGLGLLSFVRSETSPEFIALDEVFSYVDEQTKEGIFLILEKLKERFRDIFVVSHDKSIVESISNVIVVNKVNGISRIEKQYYQLPND